MLLGMTVLILLRPMNAVYGLMGTGGSIRIFFFNFIVISLIFSLIYYVGFFREAGITYDVNQPHIDYQLFAETDNLNTSNIKEKVTTKQDTVLFEHQQDSIIFTEKIITTTADTLHYQRISFPQVWKSTLLTTLTQDATDLLTIASVHNESMGSTNSTLDKEKGDLFEWILIFHVLISWIFFGVFISLLYNKFRYES